jgi:hypothetical protein
MVPVPGLVAAAVPGGVLLSWEAYQSSDLIGHQLVGYRLYRNSYASKWGPRIADEVSGLGPGATSFKDSAIPRAWSSVFYTLVAVEPVDFGSRPYGEGGSVPYGV